MKRLAGILAVAGLVVVVSASGAWAKMCPKMANEAKVLLSSTSSNTDKYAKGKGLIEKGEGQHKAGQHGDSEKTLDEALKVLRTQ